MAIHFVGPLCSRYGCSRPDWKDGLCHACWRLGRLFGKDPELFAYEPLHGYRDDRDAVPLPWDRWESDARAGVRSVTDLLADPRGARHRPAA
ncbi:MAG TPA: hypothetical protein VN213_16085 [Solirubrobacteraceae bacterium]|nr:hypothetical protein [Solirubrobacteraceae bacterium]